MLVWKIKVALTSEVALVLQTWCGFGAAFVLLLALVGWLLPGEDCWRQRCLLTYTLQQVCAPRGGAVCSLLVTKVGFWGSSRCLSVKVPLFSPSVHPSWATEAACQYSCPLKQGVPRTPGGEPGCQTCLFLVSLLTGSREPLSQKQLPRASQWTNPKARPESEKSASQRANFNQEISLGFSLQSFPQPEILVWSL